MIGWKHKGGLGCSRAFLLVLRVVFVSLIFPSNASPEWPFYSFGQTHCSWPPNEGIAAAAECLGSDICAFYVLILIPPLLVNLYSRTPCNSSGRKDFQSEFNNLSKTLSHCFSHLLALRGKRKDIPWCSHLNTGESL